MKLYKANDQEGEKMAQEKKEPSRREFIKTLAGLGLGAAMAQTLYSSLNPKQRAQLVAWAQSFGKPMTYAELGRLIDAAAWDDVVRAVRYQPASYIIYQAPDGSYQAKNGNTGQIEFSGTDAASVINQAINALSQQGGGILHIKAGYYICKSTINPISRLTVSGEGWAGDAMNNATTLFCAFNGDLFGSATATHEVTFTNITLVGDKASYPNSRGVHLGGSHIRFIGCRIQNFGAECINLDSTIASVILPILQGCLVELAGSVGVKVGAGNGVIVSATDCRDSPINLDCQTANALIVGSKFEPAYNVNVYLHDTEGISFIANSVLNSTNKAIQMVNLTKSMIIGNLIKNSTAYGIGGVGISEETGSDQNQIFLNEIVNFTTRYRVTGANTQVIDVNGNMLSLAQNLSVLDIKGLQVIQDNTYPRIASPQNLDLYLGAYGLSITKFPVIKNQDGILYAPNGLATRIKAGIPADTDYTAPIDGIMVVDSSNNRLWIRVGGIWRYIALT